MSELNRKMIRVWGIPWRLQIQLFTFWKWWQTEECKGRVKSKSRWFKSNTCIHSMPLWTKESGYSATRDLTTNINRNLQTSSQPFATKVHPQVKEAQTNQRKVQLLSMGIVSNTYTIPLRNSWTMKFHCSDHRILRVKQKWGKLKRTRKLFLTCFQKKQEWRMGFWRVLSWTECWQSLAQVYKEPCSRRGHTTLKSLECLQILSVLCLLLPSLCICWLTQNSW